MTQKNEKVKGCGKKQERESFSEDSWYWYCNSERLCNECSQVNRSNQE